MHQIISVDLDGTLLSPENQITEYTKKTIQLLEKKFYFILASGRHHIDVLQIRDILNIQSFMITSNGAKVYNLNNELIFSSDLDEDISLKLCNIVYSDQDIITQVYQNNRWYINNNKIENNFCPALTNLKYQYFDLDNFKFTNISKIFFTSKNYKKLYNIEKKIINCWSDKVNISFSVLGCLEVISRKTSKGHGLKLISNLMGIPLDHFISFGDGMNDEDMLRISGKAYIMKNADTRLKAALPKLEVIESNNNNGVARCLNRMFIKNNNILKKYRK
ncbi:Cof-type HAD-IIB family hydrolase [Buchnera aphidicola]|uniref:Yigl n=1 Tax=Buchnera aphidicola str. USDA (Myzus persicae) TaxID=1009856 RepID=W0P0N6_BUCMP|nr:Cof-type HAD-IIB family hydrolase [Buchnera aphidicola]AHG60331.1 Yigl [Buchnera aphidicola str. USDA (Myzus persicae)]AHG60909.1 Yigl [Buchnera aphidicola str. W106 (Myzus persicae)]AHG61481.1 Yigl [Buchnera aphidicola str. G002 (Myzus persicae)]AHG62054.1 Yigl [Buchnera aphidicola str. F009 (Myzus persicae)]WAI02982.1 MAG: Cof-type HAD-IIB family hydrolase [Buchnera aphidicola (Myzus persicae)]